jgi:hypothetical protein
VSVARVGDTVHVLVDARVGRAREPRDAGAAQHEPAGEAHSTAASTDRVIANVGSVT